jgi:hypothetical protein
MDAKEFRDGAVQSFDRVSTCTCSTNYLDRYFNKMECVRRTTDHFEGGYSERLDAILAAWASYIARSSDKRHIAEALRMSLSILTELGANEHRTRSKDAKNLAELLYKSTEIQNMIAHIKGGATKWESLETVKFMTEFPMFDVVETHYNKWRESAVSTVHYASLRDNVDSCLRSVMIEYSTGCRDGRKSKIEDVERTTSKNALHIASNTLEGRALATVFQRAEEALARAEEALARAKREYDIFLNTAVADAVTAAVADAVAKLTAGGGAAGGGC